MRRGRKPKETSETQIDTPVQESVPMVEKDSSFNCSDCKGEGLKDNSTLCPVCHGTGKM